MVRNMLKLVRVLGIAAFFGAIIGAAIAMAAEPFFAELYRRLGIMPSTWVGPVLTYLASEQARLLIALSLGLGLGILLHWAASKFERRASDPGLSVINRRIPTKKQREIAAFISGYEFDQERFDVFYFSASVECAALATDIAQALKLAGWKSNAVTSIFGDDPEKSDVDITVSGEGYSPPIVTALSAALRDAGLRVHVSRMDAPKPGLSIYVGRPS